MSPKQKTIPVPDLARVAEVAEPEKKDAAGVVDLVGKLEISDHAHLITAVQWVAEVKEKRDRVEAKKKEFTAPLKQVVKGIEEFFGGPLADLKNAEAKLKKAIGEYTQGLEEKRFALISRAGEAIREGDKEDGEGLLAEAETYEGQKIAGLSVRKSQEIEITDPCTAVGWCLEHDRADLLVLNEKALKALAKAEALPPIPGVTVRPKATVAITVSKVER